MDLLVTLIIGGIVGWLASILMNANSQMGIIANVLIGIVGSFLGQALVRAAGVAYRGQLAHWLVAVGGAALLIVLLRSLGVFRRLTAASR